MVNRGSGIMHKTPTGSETRGRAKPSAPFNADLIHVMRTEGLPVDNRSPLAVSL